MRRSHESLSLWQAEEAGKEELAPLGMNLEADICIIGAGISGLTTGYLLAKAKKNVVIIDSWGLTAGETARTSAHLTAVLDERFFRLENIFGEEITHQVAASHRAAIDQIEAIIKKEKINCDFERLDGYLVAQNSKQENELQKETDAAGRAGFDRKIIKKIPGRNILLQGPALRFSNQAIFNSAKYIKGLHKAFIKAGGRIYDAHASEIQGGENAFVKTEGRHTIKANHIIVTTNVPVNDWVKMHTKQAAYRTYCLAFAIRKNSFPPLLLWDMVEPYHYVRVVRGEKNDYLLVGGQDHKTGQANDSHNRYRRLERFARRNFANLGEVKFRWSGQIIEPVDSLAFIGRNPGEKNVYIATSFSGNGMTYGTIAGMLLKDLACGYENSWEKIYDPARITFKTSDSFIEENANVVGCMIKDWMSPSEVRAPQDLRNGQAAVIRKGLTKIAAYRDMEGKLHQRSAVCTHMGCIVQWNNGEKSWDCPCHGSRFNCDGKILNGPAIGELEEVK